LNLDYICLGPGFAREVLESYETWDGKETLPWKMKELMMVIEMEVSRLYKTKPPPVKTESKIELKDTTLD
jgi:hypothetical protein